MSDVYVECLVKAKQSPMGKFFKVLLITLTVIFGLMAMVGIVIGLIVAVVTGVGAYFVNLYTDIEYEYLYLDTTSGSSLLTRKVRPSNAKVVSPGIRL